METTMDFTSYKNSFPQTDLKKMPNRPAADFRLFTGARTWAVIHTDALVSNVKAIRRLLPSSCSVMAVVKANAYGHGDLEVASCLNRTGIRDFAVATLEEGIRLRQGGVTGTILILGYTPARMAQYLREYSLTQTIVDVLHGR